MEDSLDLVDLLAESEIDFAYFMLDCFTSPTHSADPEW